MRTDFVQAGEVKLQYFEHGAGPELLVLVHGYRSSARIWRLVARGPGSQPVSVPWPSAIAALAILSAPLRKRITRWSPLPGTCSQRRRHLACGILPSWAIPWAARP